MPPYQLYAFGESGNAFKVALMLQACGLEWKQINVDFFNGETRSETYRADVNEMGEVPVLVHGGAKMAQSGAILIWLASKTGKFGGANAAEKQEILSWILFDNHKFTSNIATLRFLVALIKSGETPVTEFLRSRSYSAIKIVEKHLTGHRFIVGDQPSIADFSMCGYLFHPEQYGIDWGQFPNIRHWLDRIAAIPGWKAPYDMLVRAPAKRG